MPRRAVAWVTAGPSRARGTVVCRTERDVGRGCVGADPQPAGISTLTLYCYYAVNRELLKTTIIEPVGACLASAQAGFARAGIRTLSGLDVTSGAYGVRHAAQPHGLGITG
jgi:hypothetical protein